MSDRPVDRGLRALRALHAQLWDPDADLARLAPGVNPGADLSAWNLHAVRETALGAVLDLRDGEVERAVAALRQVLANQYVDSGFPWSGTFKVSAEEQAPPAVGAREWFHYDPNWRQFLGCLLAYTLERHSASLPARLTADIEHAISRCVHGEPDDRIPAWYTNPNLMHAWLTSWLGVRSGDPRLVRAGEARLQRTMQRFDRYGDVDEYNSPTYDGIDLFAAALWCAYPPTPVFEPAGVALARGIGNRLGALYHPGLGAICGPYIRAYGLDLGAYVSLAGQWLALAGADVDRVLPVDLDERSVHVHDLYFLPLFADLADSVVGHIAPHDVLSPREHEQRFGSVVAMSHLDRAWAIGAERGRVPAFAKDQYVPFTAHVLDGAGLTSVGIKLGDATARVDVRMTDHQNATITARGASDVVELVVIASSEPSRRGASVDIGRVALDCSDTPSRVAAKSNGAAVETVLSWDSALVEINARVKSW